MGGVRLSRSLCAAVNDLVVANGTHPKLDALFQAAGAPGPPPQLAHHSKWKEWLFSVNAEPELDSLAVLGNVIEERMDAAPSDPEAKLHWEQLRQRVVEELEVLGLQYFRGGRVVPTGREPEQVAVGAIVQRPAAVDDVLRRVIRGLPRAMYPLTYRRKGSTPLTFMSEYDIQDLLHAMLRPWVVDIRPEEFTPSYAGTSTRMDFLLPKQSLVIELKVVRDRAHAKKIGQELTIDIDHYRAHPLCDTLWCVVYDLAKLIENPAGLVADLEGERSGTKGKVRVRVEVVT